MDPFLGQISLLGCNFAPQGWALCQGQLLSIAQNTALFSLLGVNFGGDGRTNFQLPDLRGRAPVGFGQGPGLSAYTIGQTGGGETISISSANHPAHSHTLSAAASAATGNVPNGLFEAQGQTGGRGGTVNLPAYSGSGAPTTFATVPVVWTASGEE